MKKLFISADIEGVCGVTDWKETEIGEGQGLFFRQQMTKEVAAVCEAAVQKGFQDILVKDAHDSGRSIRADLLPESVRLIRAWTRDPLFMMAGLDSSFSASAYIGYHAPSGSGGNPLSHTMTTRIQRLLLNGTLTSEFMINAYTSAYFKVPSVLVSGDETLCEIAQDLIPEIKTVPVSNGIGNASCSIHPALAVKKINEAMTEALSGDLSRFLIRLPEKFDVSMEFKLHHLAYRAAHYPGATQLDDVTVGFQTSSWFDVLRFFLFVL